MVKQTSAGQGTGVATNTSVHSWCDQNFHSTPRWPISSILWFQTEEGDKQFVLLEETKLSWLSDTLERCPILERSGGSRICMGKRGKRYCVVLVSCPYGSSGMVCPIPTRDPRTQRSCLLVN
jgi:hypothetical protein